jgi:hypothetical protein
MYLQVVNNCKKGLGRVYMTALQKRSAKACLIHIKSCVNPEDPRSVAHADAMVYWEQRITDGAHVAAMQCTARTQS